MAMSVLREILADLKASLFNSLDESGSPAGPASEAAPVTQELPSLPPAPAVQTAAAAADEAEPPPPAAASREEPAPDSGPEPLAAVTAEEVGPPPSAAASREEPAPDSGPDPLAAAAADEAEPPPPAAASREEPARDSRPRQEVHRRRWYLAAGGCVILAAALAAILFLARPTLPARAPSEDVVATYTFPWDDSASVVQITKSELSSYLAGLPAERRAGIPESTAGYRSAVEEMVIDRLLWNGLLGRMGPDSMREMLASVLNDRYPAGALDRVIATVPIADSQVRMYYDNHSEHFGGRALSEVREEILTWLRQQQAATFAESYVATLRARAYIVGHDEVLAVPEVDEPSMAAYFEEHRAELALPRRAQVSLLRFHLREASLQAAEAARSELEQGQDLATLGPKYASHGTMREDAVIVEGEWAKEFEVVFGLQPGEVSPVIHSGDAYYVVVLKQPIQEAVADYDRVKDKIRATLWIQAADAWFETQAESPLFEINNYAYRAGDFYRALASQPEDVRAAYGSTPKLRELVGRTINWLLIVEEVSRQGYPPEGEGGAFDRLELLVMMTGESVPEIAAAGDDEALAYLKKHSEKYTMPTRFVIRYVAVELGSTAAEKSLARKRVQEAYDKLVQLKRPPEEAEFLTLAGGLVENQDTCRPSAWIVAARPEDIQVIDTGEELTAHPLYNALQKLQAGDVAAPIELDGTLFLAQVLQREDERQFELDNVLADLNASLELEQVQSATRELSRLLLDRVALTVYGSNLKAMLAGE